MWLYVPYQSAQDTQELNSESPQWQMLSRSATSKETWRKPLSWDRAFKQLSYLTLLSGVTSTPSTLSRGVAEWISSLEVSHVSHSVSQDKNGKPTTSEIYGPTLFDSQGSSGIQLSFAKTYPAFFATTGMSSDQAYKQWATALRKDSTQRLKQALRTKGSDYSLWPTVTQDSATMRDKPYAQGGTPLTLEAANWRTPTSMESGLNPERVGEFQWGQRNYDKETGRLAQTGLTQQVKVWPTPATRDHKGFDSPGKKHTHQDPAMYLSTRPDQPIETDGHTCSTKCLRLNPLFAEWLMGIPQNWTALEDYGVSVTESYPPWRLSLGVILQRSCASLAH